MATYVVLDIDNNIVNVIEWDGVQEWTPPTNCTARVMEVTDTFNG